MAFRILFVYNAVPEAELKGLYGECMTFTTITTIAEALTQEGHHVFQLNLRSPIQLREFVKAYKPFDLAFCIAEGFLALPSTLVDGSGTAWVRRLLAELEIPMTHSSAATMEICRHKDNTYQVLASQGIKVPNHFIVRPEANAIDQQLAAIEKMMSFPLFVKPCGGGNSLGISEDSIVNNAAELRQQVYHLIETLGKLPLSVETYLPGQEYTIGIIGNEEKTVFPILAFPQHEEVRSRVIKRTSDTARELQRTIDSNDPGYWRLYKLALNTFTAVGAHDILRIDVREDEQGNPYVIDVNGTPTLSSSASLPYMAERGGLSYRELLSLLVNTALDRLYNQEMSEVSS